MLTPKSTHSVLSQAQAESRSPCFAISHYTDAPRCTIPPVLRQTSRFSARGHSCSSESDIPDSDQDGPREQVPGQMAGCRYPHFHWCAMGAYT